MSLRRLRFALPTAVLLLSGVAYDVATATSAQAAGEAVNVYLTTTSDSQGLTVTRGLQQQTPVAFASSSAGANQTINVDENTTYQQFEGAGASFTDSAAWLLNSSGLLSSSARDTVMRKLFDPVDGIGISFVRNPMGASDLARYNYTYDDSCCSVDDFSIAHDMVDVLPLTKQAKALNPDLKIMASPWTAPPWMKDNNSYIGGWLQSQYYGTYGQYFAKYVKAYEAQGVHIDYVTPQNEPTVGGNYPGMMWNASGLQNFVKNGLWPAFRNAGITTTKTLIGDWNWDTYDTWVAPLLNDTAIRNDPLFGGIAWHGYGGNVATQTTVHNLFPNVNAYMTEHSGGTWITNTGSQHAEDMNNLIDYTRNWDRSWIKWSLAIDQAHNPHNGGCDVCTGLVTVHNGDGRNGQVDYTIEYYTMGHLTKFVRPGAYRIASTDNASVKNVAWKNPDGSKALIAYNTTGSTQTVKVTWGGQSFTYSLPTRTSATFTWNGTQSGGGGTTPTAKPIVGQGKCVDVTDGNTANGTQLQLWDCYAGSPNQQWTVGTDGTIRAFGKCMDVNGGLATNGTAVQLYDCNGSAAQQWTHPADGTLRALGKCLDATGNSSANGTKLQIWDCFAGANQKWTL